MFFLILVCTFYSTKKLIGEVIGNIKFEDEKANNDVLDGIRLVGMLLNLEKIVFASSCKETIKEFASYIWDEKALERGEDKPVKQFDHCCDAVRYLCSTIIGRKAARFREIRR